MKLVIVLLAVVISASTASAQSVPLGKDETLWQNGDMLSDLKTPIDWNGFELVIVQTKQPDGKVGGVLRAIKDGKATDVATWQLSNATAAFAAVHVRKGKAAFEFGRAMNLDARDNGTDAYLELVVKKGKVTTGKKWSGDRASTRPAWVKAIDPAM
ncbi:MAG TPA: hypothetical protein VL463_18685 [Kofleriaceae bacterium]|nr:hypothetical protein [Kofleriaceae bacterium]